MTYATETGILDRSSQLATDHVYCGFLKDKRGPQWLARLRHGCPPANNVAQGPLTFAIISIIVEVSKLGLNSMHRKNGAERIPRYADMLSAMGTEPRLRIMRLLL